MTKSHTHFLMVCIYVFVLLVIVSSLFPANPIQIAIMESGESNGVIGGLPNGTEIIQPISIQDELKELQFRVATYGKEVQYGKLQLSFEEKDTNSVIFEREWNASDLWDNQLVSAELNIQPGLYDLCFRFSEFDDDSLMTLYSVNPQKSVQPCLIDGIPVESAIYYALLTQNSVLTKDSVFFPDLAVLIGAGVLLWCLMLKKWRSCKKLVFLTASSALMCVGVSILPFGYDIKHYSIITLVIIAAFAYLLPFARCKSYLLQFVHLLVAFCARMRKHLAVVSIIVLLSVLLGWGVETLYSVYQKVGFMWIRWLFWSLTMCIVACHVLFYKWLYHNLSYSFLIVALAFGLFISFFSPSTSLVTWDDQIHYIRTIHLSQGETALLSGADYAIGSLQIEKSYSLGTIQENNAILEELATSAGSRSDSAAWQLARVGYLPHVFGMWLGQILGLPFWGTFVLGRTANLIFCVLVIYYGMRRLKSGQLILYVIGLLPTVLFQSASYTYDSWVNCMSMLGLSYLVGAMQRSDEIMTGTEISIMVFSLTIGLFPKAVYAPMILLLLILPKEKFASSKQYSNYLKYVIVACAVCCVSYIVPFIVGGGFDSTSDIRGGAGVNSIEQVKFIFSNPLQYSRILLEFLGEYLSPENSVDYTCSMAYLSGRKLPTLAFTLMVAAALTDRSQCDLYYRKTKYIVYSAGLMFAVVCLVATALYISFTPVGHHTINGCQGRYLIPFLFPTLIICGNIYVNVDTKQLVYKEAISYASMYILFINIWSAVVKVYTP